MVQTCETPPGMAGFAEFVPDGNDLETATNAAPNQAVFRPRATL